MTRQGRYPQELRERAVRLVFEHQARVPQLIGVLGYGWG
jgi:transposase-like protein